MRNDSSITKAILNAGRSLCKHVPGLRKLRYVWWAKQQRSYEALSAKAMTEPKTVIFEAFGGRRFVCSPKAIYLAMCADPRFDDWTFYWSFMEDKIEEARAIPELGRAQLVKRNSEEYFDAFARAGYWIQNNRVPEFMHPRADQTYVQCWHGTPLKRLGYDVTASVGGALNTPKELADRFNLDAQKWTYFITSSPFSTQHLCDGFGLPPEKRPSTVIEEGYPRNDSIVNTVCAANSAELIARLKDHYGIPQGKKVLMFAPTFRDDQFTEGVGYTLNALIDFDCLRSKLGSEWVVMLRTHYYIANKFDLTPWADFVFNVSDADEVNDLYCMADALCTDYSSVIFDYANTGRPLYFYWPDRQHYEQDLHGFYVDVDALPGPHCETAESLADALLAYDEWSAEYGSAYQEFIQTFCPKDDGHAAERVIAKVFPE